MHVVAASGEKIDVSPSQARSWPLAGTQMHTEQGQWGSGLRMGNLPTGEARILTLRKIYKSNPWVWAAVNMKANGLASFPLRVTDWGENGQRVPVHGDHPKSTPGPLTAAGQLDRRLNHPAPGLSRRRLVRRLMVDKLIYGNGIWVKDPDYMGGIAALYNAPWRQISVMPGTTRPIDGYRIMGPAGSKVWDVGDVVQFGEGDSDTLIAPSPLESLQYTIALMDALSRHLVAFFQNSARPSGILRMENMPDDKELTFLREQIQELYSGPENAGRPLITSGSWSPMNGGTSYTDLVELAKLSRDEVSIAYNIPPPVLGIMDRAIKPLDPSTEVRMADGTNRRLGALMLGAQVVTHTGAVGNVIRLHPAGVQPRLRVTTGRGRVIVGAPDHPFLTVRGWVKLGDLAPSDRLVTEQQTGSLAGAGDPIRSIEHLTPGPVVCIEIDHPDHSFVANGVIVSNSNVSELREQFLRDVLASDGSEMTDEIVAQVMDPAPQWAGLSCGFDMSERLLPDIEALAVAFRELKRVYTLNELRRMCRLPDLPFEWANQPWMEPGSLPAGLAPQGATVAPDDMAESDEAPAAGDLDDEDDEDE